MMARPVRISLHEAEALRLLLKVKPTGEMPRPGTNPSIPKKKRAKKTGEIRPK